MTSRTPPLAPVVAALGEGLEQAAPSVRQQLALGARAADEPARQGHAKSEQAREWQQPHGRVGLSLVLHHPLFGNYAGYEAELAPGHRS